MNEDHRQTRGLITGVLDVLEKHGSHYTDERNAGRTVGLVGDLARIFEGTPETPAGACPAPLPEPRRAGPGTSVSPAESADALAAAGMPGIVIVFGEASDYRPDGAAVCADCEGRFCGTCPFRLDAAKSCGRLAGRLGHAVASWFRHARGCTSAGGSRIPPRGGVS